MQLLREEPFYRLFLRKHTRKIQPKRRHGIVIRHGTDNDIVRPNGLAAAVATNERKPFYGCVIKS